MEYQGFHQHFPPRLSRTLAPGCVDRPLDQVTTFQLSGTDRFPVRPLLARPPGAIAFVPVRCRNRE